MKHEILLSAPEIIKSFLIYSETIKNKSANSVNEYYTDLRTFFRYILTIRGLVPKDTEFKEIDISSVDLALVKTITLQDLYSFLVFCKNELNNSANTRARKCSVLKIYFKYLALNTKQLDSNPAELLEAPKTSRSLPRHLTLEDSIKLLENVDGPNKERDYCILTLFLNCGLRLSELCGINLNDISSDGKMRVLGKGNKERMIYLNQACVTALENYLRVRPVDGIPPEHKNALFISRNRRRISNKTVQHIVYTFLDKAGFGNSGLSTHKLRHTAATLMYQKGKVDIRSLKEVLGHSSLNTTQIYTHVSDESVKNAFDSNPLANIKSKKG
ncbi:MAG: tyrosine recombinase XerC [Clostridia bacterium]|nr:tyrosine recombinase XerC [Clostridia bacterium]